MKDQRCLDAALDKMGGMDGLLGGWQEYDQGYIIATNSDFSVLIVDDDQLITSIGNYSPEYCTLKADTWAIGRVMAAMGNGLKDEGLIGIYRTSATHWECEIRIKNKDDAKPKYIDRHFAGCSALQVLIAGLLFLLERE